MEFFLNVHCYRACVKLNSGHVHDVCYHVWNFREHWFTAIPLNFKTNLTYKPVKNPLYNIHCFDVMLTVSKLMPTIHTSMISTFQWGDFRELKSTRFSGGACPLGARLGNRSSQPRSAPASNDLFLINTFLWYRFCFVHFSNWQGSNLTFELNSQMASACLGFTSHKRVSTSLGTSVQHKIKKVRNPVVIKR